MSEIYYSERRCSQNVQTQCWEYASHSENLNFQVNLTKSVVALAKPVKETNIIHIKHLRKISTNKNMKEFNHSMKVKVKVLP